MLKTAFERKPASASQTRSSFPSRKDALGEMVADMVATKGCEILVTSSANEGASISFARIFLLGADLVSHAADRQCLLVSVAVDVSHEICQFD